MHRRPQRRPAKPAVVPGVAVSYQVWQPFPTIRVSQSYYDVYYDVAQTKSHSVAKCRLALHGLRES